MGALTGPGLARQASAWSSREEPQPQPPSRAQAKAEAEKKQRQEAGGTRCGSAAHPALAVSLFSIVIARLVRAIQ